jgi:hypothetical protein
VPQDAAARNEHTVDGEGDMPEGISIEVEGGYARISFPDPSKRGRVLAKLLDAGTPISVDTGELLKVYIVPEGNARDAGLIDKPAPKAAPPAKKTAPAPKPAEETPPVVKKVAVPAAKKSAPPAKKAAKKAPPTRAKATPDGV